ncbi:hypothetical protein [Beijerinckia mobilis]|uniref:COG3904 family protein n=1 Tax=Beijerinckia mobilis TaxID=231434 RepID=UPI0012EC856C|nr:hypothetical protein [Beijerinckia mobilis]
MLWNKKQREHNNCYQHVRTIFLIILINICDLIVGSFSGFPRVARPQTKPALSHLALTFGLAVFALFLTPEARAEPMEFHLVPRTSLTGCSADCRIVVMEGDITDATPDAFLEFMQAHGLKHGPQPIVYIHSNGGKVMAAMELGKIFRHFGVTAVVGRFQGNGKISGAHCYSACVYALMGARKRVIPLESELGLHRMYLVSIEGRQQDDGEMKQVLEHYTRSMGVSPNVIVTAEHMRPDDVYIVSREEISKWRLGTATL